MVRVKVKKFPFSSVRIVLGCYLIVCSSLCISLSLNIYIYAFSMRFDFIWPGLFQITLMHSFTAAIFLAVVGCSLWSFTESQYTPDWTSLDARPLPAWYDESKIGIFIHWGVFSVPSISSEWSVRSFFRESQHWFLLCLGCGGRGKGPILILTWSPSWIRIIHPIGPTPISLLNSMLNSSVDFTLFVFRHCCVLLDPNEWADLFAASGAKWVRLSLIISPSSLLSHPCRYIVLTSKVCISRNESMTISIVSLSSITKVSPCGHRSIRSTGTQWTSVQNEIFSVGMRPIDDAHSSSFVILGDLATAIRSRTDLVFGLYHSMFEWFNPLYLEDKQNGFKTQMFTDVSDRRRSKLRRSNLVELVENVTRIERDRGNLQTVRNLVRWWLGFVSDSDVDRSWIVAGDSL